MSESKEDLDRREIQWFWDNRAWRPDPDVQVDQWLTDMRVKDDTLCAKGCFPAGHLEEMYDLRVAVDEINELRRSRGLKPLTEYEAMT